MKVVVTGAAGFIGSAMVWQLNQHGVTDILAVDELGSDDRWRNLVGLRFTDLVHKDSFITSVQRDDLAFEPDAVIHMGACSSTTEPDADYLLANNTHYTRHMAEWCLKHDARFIYASSAATYGDGERGFDDADAVTPTLSPLNMYGYSKHLFDLQAMERGWLDRMVGLKFFNVFGPNEYHKAGMVSMVYRAYHQILETGSVKLFKSHRAEYADGCQTRDFIYVKDCVEAMWWLLNNPQVNGLFNLGTGQARTWLDLANAVFTAMGRAPKIEFVELPEILRDKYQYHTQADMGKLRAAGYCAPMSTLEKAVSDYVSTYLAKDCNRLGAI